MTGDPGTGDRPAALDDGAVHALARAITAEHEQRAGFATYLALPDDADPGATDGPALAGLERWHAVLDVAYSPSRTRSTACRLGSRYSG